MGKFFVTHNSSKKLVIVETVTYENIQTAVAAKFGLEPCKCILQYWFEDEGISDWLDLDADSIEEVSGSESKYYKLNLILSEQQIVNEKEPDCEEMDSNVSSLLSTSLNVSTEQCQSSFSAPSAQSTPRGKKLPFPQEYTVPVHQLPSSMRVKQTKRLSLQDSDYTRLLQVVYNHVTTSYENGFYPQSDEYFTISSGILKSFPQLLTHQFMSQDEVQRNWKDRVQRKWQNARKRQDQEELQVQARKRKRKSTKAKDCDSGPTDLGDTEYVHGITNFLPKRPESEDDLSIQRHRDWLAVEKRKKPSDADLNKVERLMRLTLPERRQLVVNEKVSAKQLCESYPWLSGSDGILNEYQRLGPRAKESDGVKAVKENVKAYGESLLEMAKTKGKKDTVLKELRAIKDTNSFYASANTCAVFLSVPLLLGETTDSVFVQLEDDAPESHVAKDFCIQYEGPLLFADDFTIVMEGQKVGTSSSPEMAMAGYIAAFYVFNYGYPAYCKLSLELFSFLFLGINDKSAVSGKVKTVLNKLGNRVQK